MAMGIEYDGSAFHGWQAQQVVRTIQQEVEAAVSRVADHQVRIHCAGRTDAGVHAEEQVIHFDTSARRTERSWVLGSNVNLPPDVAVVWAKSVDPQFHARFSALARHYRYLVQSRPTRSPLLRNRTVWMHQRLDLETMQAAAALLVGEHDFSSFRALNCQAKSPVRRVHYCRLSKQGELYQLEVGANGFLHHMVRNIAGVLLTIGRGEASVQWVRELLGIRDRTRGGITAPPQGLCFIRADYAPDFALPQRHLGRAPWAL
jgi:tRNA pseudouridine38-40 synthase